MHWYQPLILFFVPPALALLWWAQRRSLHPMPPERRWALLAVRAALVTLALLALAGPSVDYLAEQQAVIFVTDHSQSQGPRAMAEAMRRVNALAAQLPADTYVGVVSAGDSAV